MNKAETWLEKTLHYRFQNAELFQQALTHRSATNRNNERLEFLGDAVLDFVVSGAVYRAYPEAAEGDLSKLRAALVKDVTLAQLASEMGLGEHLILGSGEQKTGGHRRESILADALEAIFGAVFLDSGFDAAKQLIDQVYEQRYRNLPDIKDLRDPKTRLQEWLQARKMELPNYELVEVSGKDHKQRFSVTCTVVEKSAASTGESTTRRKAEQKAARKMMEILSENEQ
ncbi:MAG: ribonuclease III [Woeseiaceae bacterium]|nr:ribonuclease III [Woeseiaceae bacterium]